MDFFVQVVELCFQHILGSSDQHQTHHGVVGHLIEVGADRVTRVGHKESACLAMNTTSLMTQAASKP